MSSFSVVVDALSSASSAIGAAAHRSSPASVAAASAAGQAGAFEDEPIAVAFSAICSRGQSATAQLEEALGSLSRCVGLAAEGYLLTDRGIVQACAVDGTTGSGEVQPCSKGGARP